MSAFSDIEAVLNQDPQTRSRPDDVLIPWRTELAGYVADMKNLRYTEVDEAMGWLSSVSARVLEIIYATLQSEGRLATKFRVEELLPLRDELRYQFQIASRRHSMNEFDWKLSGGQAT